ncbi:MAG: glycosyltransferase family 1 protein [Calditrichaeota bacterium]|nr:MAG: glycosyltransferase family 1 protein [Calditrichota bacterium]
MITNAADTRKIKPQVRDQEIEQRYNLKDKRVIGWVGAGHAWTGIEVLMKAVTNVMPKFQDVCVMMIGTENNMKFFREQFKDTDFFDRIKLVGFIPNDEIPRYLSCMDITIAPYPRLDLFYASSMKLFEYMAAGKAVVATRIGQLAEVMKDGENGYLYDPDDAQELTEKVTALLENDAQRKAFGRAVRQAAEKEYNWDRVGEKMLEVFEKVLKKN